MTNPISQFGRIAQMDTSARATAAKGEPRKTDDAEAPAAARPPVSRGDELQLSEVARQAMQEPEFDRAKVEAIKTAIQEGKYPLDSRRIAENFVAIEKMIQG
jgi:negative regulator of flagellin synthesis FlgM